MRAVDVLPLVPVMWIEGYERCGSPRTSISAEMRLTEGSSLVSPHRVASSASTSRRALSSSGSSGRAGTSACGWPPWVRRVRLPASMTARSGSRSVSAATISSKGSVSLTGPVYGGRLTECLRSGVAGRRWRARGTLWLVAQFPAPLGSSSLRKPVQLLLDPLDVLVRLGQAAADLVHHVVRGLRQERLVAQLGLGLLALLLRRRQVLREALALGRHVDRAGEVERDRGTGDRKGGRGRE